MAPSEPNIAGEDPAGEVSVEEALRDDIDVDFCRQVGVGVVPGSALGEGDTYLKEKIEFEPDANRTLDEFS